MAPKLIPGSVLLKEDFATGIYAGRLRNGQGELLGGQMDTQAALSTRMHPGPKAGEMELALLCIHFLERNSEEPERWSKLTPQE